MDSKSRLCTSSSALQRTCSQPMSIFSRAVMDNRVDADEIRGILRNAFEQIGNIQNREANVESQNYVQGAVAPAGNGCDGITANGVGIQVRPSSSTNNNTSLGFPRAPSDIISRAQANFRYALYLTVSFHVSFNHIKGENCPIGKSLFYNFHLCISVT